MAWHNSLALSKGLAGVSLWLSCWSCAEAPLNAPAGGGAGGGGASNAGAGGAGVAGAGHDASTSDAGGAAEQGTSGSFALGGGAASSGGAGGTAANAMSGASGAGGGSSGAAGSSEPGGGRGGAGPAQGGSSGAPGEAVGGGSNEVPPIVLFGGADLNAWQPQTGAGGAAWTLGEGWFAVAPGQGDLRSRQSFGDMRLHVEFWIPSTPAGNAEQDRGNSGIYLQGRYELQVLDSHQHPLEGANDCGAIYELKDADENAALPAGSWQTYDITFRAPRWSGAVKTENARISVTWNGRLAHDGVEIPGPTRLGDEEAPGRAPLRLQDHGHGVRYRNVWLREL
jgi:Domain of Unknown Function (DUF1080)